MYLDDLSESAVLEVEMQHHWYTIVIGGNGVVHFHYRPRTVS